MSDIAEELFGYRTEVKRLEAEIERLTAERDSILKAVLYHFGPKGANKVCTSVLEAPPQQITDGGERSFSRVMHRHEACKAEQKPDLRDPDPTREGIFRDHNCWKCREGQKPCAQGSPRNCEYPHARND